MKKFTLIEMVMVMAVILILAGALITVIAGSREKANELRCLAALRNLNGALTAYVGDHGFYPLGELEAALQAYSVDPKDLYCPTTEMSYEQFFVCRGRNRFEHGSYVVGCPGHEQEQVSYGDNQTAAGQMGTVLWNGDEAEFGQELGQNITVTVPTPPLLPGAPLPPLALPTLGSAEFGDGSKAHVLAGKMSVIASYKDSNGTWYTIVRIPASSPNTIIDFDVTPGSRFEVVTPAAIAGVKGTQFQVVSVQLPLLYDTTINVSSGEVQVRSHKGDWRSLTAGQFATISTAIDEILLDP